jgi:hypothetical protein
LETSYKPPSSQKLGRLGGIGATKHKKEVADETNVSPVAPSSIEVDMLITTIEV